MRRKTGWLRPAVLLVLGFVLIIGPVTVRNAVVGGDFVPISYHGGINFWIGNHPGAMGTFDLPPGITGTPEQVNIIDSTRLATEELGRPLRPSEVSAYWFRKGWEFVRDNPGEYLRLLVRKVRMFWNRTEIPVNVSFHFLQRSSVCLRIPFMHFGVIAPLAVLGMILGLRQWQRRLPIYSFAAVHFASAVVFFVTARFRLHILLALIPFACYGGWWLYMSLREKRWRHASLALIVVIPVAVHANLPVEGFNIEQSFARDYYYLASHYHSQGQVAEALTYYDLSIVRNPDFWMSYNGRGACLSDLGRLDEAIAAFRKATELAPTRSEPWTNLGIALADHGRLDEAVLAWEQALRVNRADERARSNLEEARRSLRGEEEARLPKD
jgi:tetratricopeptide (TPR) repeat protein